MKLHLYRLTTIKKISSENTIHTKHFIGSIKITKQHLKTYFPSATKINTQNHKGKKLITIKLKNDTHKSHLTWRAVASKNKTS
ncbi:hypothetical protein JSR02_00705 [Candidatus Vidania fulgoroideae]|uniref:Uncharacterized protein n=1 Tax=Candidatus Vidania fulgoroideorum TaxID=881286 RepID=A0A974X753_9PROT|nr:hypothetical protein JSR02_00705 [Candidatus Vidania fulgoroideae]